MTSKKLRLALLFGGRSGEHDVSVMSARSIVAALNPDRYEIHCVRIDADGRWQLNEAAAAQIGAVSSRLELNDRAIEALTVPGAGVLARKGNEATLDSAPRAFDVIFPVVHGTYGEDGTLQGLLEMAGIPYVGSGVLGSAIGMDKDVSKRLLRDAGLPVVDYLVVRTHEAFASDLVERVRVKLGFPCFVKPTNLGSSVGVHKVKGPEDLLAAVRDALRFDRKVLVERAIDAREVECSVLGNDQPEASVVGEVVPNAEFYSYEAKYLDENGAALIIPAPLSREQSEAIRNLAVRAFTTLELEGMARVDFFIDKASGELYVNEVNTIPGFTAISMYPKLWEASGISYSSLLDRLIDLALERHRQRTALATRRDAPDAT